MCKKITLIRYAYQACKIHQHRIPDEGTYAMVRYELCSNAGGHFMSCGRDITWDIERQGEPEFLVCETCRVSQVSEEKPQLSNEPARAHVNTAQDPQRLGNPVDRLVEPVTSLSLDVTGKRKRATEVAEDQPAKKKCPSPTPSNAVDTSSASKISLAIPERLKERERLEGELKELLDAVAARQKDLAESLLAAPVKTSPTASPVSVPTKEEAPEAKLGTHGNFQRPSEETAEKDCEMKETSCLASVSQQPQGSPVVFMNNRDDGVSIPDAKAFPSSATTALQPAEDCSLRACTRCHGSGHEPQQIMA